MEIVDMHKSNGSNGSNGHLAYAAPTNFVIAPSPSSPYPAIAAIVRDAKQARDLTGRWEYTVDITRPLAQVLVDSTDESQRSVARSRVLEIASDIDNGRWENTGDPIRLSPTGTLVDGQHRLNAYLRSKNENFVLVDMTVVVLKERRSLDVVDTGKSRTVGDIRALTGRAQVPNRAVGGILFEANNFENKSLLSKIQRNQIVDSCEFLPEASVLSSLYASTAVIAAAIRCMRVDRVEAMKFFTAAVTNEHKIDGNEIAALRVLSTWLLTNKHNGGGHAIRREAVVRCIHAWNNYRQSKEVKHSRYYKASEIPTPV